MATSEETEHPGKVFFWWLLTRFLIPMLPILCQWAIKVIYREQYQFPNENILILAFLLPIITMAEKTVKRHTSFFLMFLSFMALMLFTIATITEIQGDGDLQQRLYLYGLWLFSFIIAVHVIPRTVSLALQLARRRVPD